MWYHNSILMDRRDAVKKLLLGVLVLILACINVAHAETLDVASMSDDELKAMHDLLEAEIERRETEARAAAALAATDSDDDGDIIYYREEGSTPKVI